MILHMKWRKVDDPVIYIQLIGGFKRLGTM